MAWLSHLQKQTHIRRMLSDAVLPPLIVIVFCALSLAACGEKGSEDAPELAIVNGVVLTMDEERPYASAFAVRNGLIVDVGENEDIEKLIGPSTEVIDAGGRTIVPGFNDAHLHALAIPPGAVDLADVADLDAALKKMKAVLDLSPADPWVIGYGYDDTVFGRHPTRVDLDQISTTRPVMFWHASLHLFVVNSIALANAGINAQTQDPKGGNFYRDAENKLTGLIAERVALEPLFVDAQPSPFAADLSTARAALGRFFDVALRYGITSYSDALVPPELAFAYFMTGPQTAGVRVNLMLDGEKYGGAIWLRRLNGIASVFGWRPFENPWLRAKTIKLFHGNSLSGRTARLHQPYKEPPGYYGEPPQRSQQELNQVIGKIDGDGFQAAVHCNGDYEIDMVLDAIETTRKERSAAVRHRIEHGSVVNDAILQRIKALGIVMAPHSYIYEKGAMIEAFGEDRWGMMFANASTFELGIPNAGNSDFPVSGLNPMLRIQSLVTRRSRQGKTYGARQAISVEQAIYAYTKGAAYGSMEENVKGSIAAGMYADFLFLSSDPRTVDPNAIKNITVENAFSDGILRYATK